mgnify:CR=1 FL=1
MFITNSPTLNPLTAIKAFFPNKLITHDRLRYFSLAREALITAIESIKYNNHTTEASTIWVPAFICDTVINILKEHSVNFKYYKVTKDLVPDFKRLETEKIVSNDIFLLVNYFGFSICQKKALDFCKNKKIFLIEDSAHSVVRKIGENEVGTGADAIVFGLRKTFPVPNGGALFLKHGDFISPTKISSNSSEYRGVMKMIVQWLFLKVGLSWNISVKHIKKGNYPVTSDKYCRLDQKKTFLHWSQKIMSVTDADKVFIRRRENFKLLHTKLSRNKSIRIPIFLSLTLENTEAVPWTFFFYHKESERLINLLIDNGVSASYWPTLPKDIFNNPDWPTENTMYRDGICLPIHQDVSKFQVNKMVQLVLDHA